MKLLLCSTVHKGINQRRILYYGHANVTLCYDFQDVGERESLIIVQGFSLVESEARMNKRRAELIMICLRVC